jgi:hypothetical protein
MNDSPGLGMMPTLHPDWFSEGNERTIDSRVPFVPRGRPGLAVPLVYDVSERALRQREMNFAAKRLVDMAFVSKLDWEDALARLRWRGVEPMGGLDAMPDTGTRKARLAAAFEAGAIAIMPDVSARAVRVVWTDPDFGAPVSGGAKAPVGWGGIVTGAREPDAVTSSPIARAAPSGRLWPLGDDVPAPPADDPVLARAVDRFLATSPGVYGVLVAGPDRILFERYGMGGAPDRVTPSWSMNKSMTGTLIGRLIQLGWLEGVHVPAPAPAWRDPRGIHALITLDDLLRMRSGLAMPYLQDGMWNGERLLPEGWAEYALAATHGGTSYAATFWTNADRRFPALPPDAAWLSGASDQRVFILRDAHRVVAVSNETDAKMDLGALNMVLAAAIAVT